MSWFRRAIHEAGHAVIALSCQRKIVGIWANENFGQCETHEVDWHVSIARARSELCIAVAGNIAELLHFGETFPQRLRDDQIAVAFLFVDPESDEAKAATAAQWLAKKLTTKRVTAVTEIKRAEKAARRILKRRWCEVLALARSIRQRQGRRLTGDDLLKLLRNHRQKALAIPNFPFGVHCQ